MRRQAEQRLIQWKNDPKRKPLIVQGARQVGKTYLIKDFGDRHFEQVVTINFELQPQYRQLFESDLQPLRIIKELSILSGTSINPGSTLLFFDEVQAAPAVLTSLKYFQELTPEYHVIAAGSLLGVHLSKASSFPVGKVNMLTLHPLNFIEFLQAIGQQPLIEVIRSIYTEPPVSEALHLRLNSLLKEYLYIGGMPEVVQTYLQTQNLKNVRTLQNEILLAYERDFSKYAKANQSIKILELWNSLPFQLIRENKKFRYNSVRRKGRSSHYEQTIQWLIGAGLVLPAYLLRTPKLPLAAYADYDKFKLYLLDTGLLCARLDIHPRIIIDSGRLFTEYYGAIIENYVAAAISNHLTRDLYYWHSPGTAEVDFIIPIEDQVYPIEVKSGTNRNTKSMRSYAAKYAPQKICRLSQMAYHEVDDFVNVPLYGVSGLKNMLTS